MATAGTGSLEGAVFEAVSDETGPDFRGGGDSGDDDGQGRQAGSGAGRGTGKRQLNRQFTSVEFTEVGAELTAQPSRPAPESSLFRAHHQRRLPEVRP